MNLTPTYEEQEIEDIMYAESCDESVLDDNLADFEQESNELWNMITRGLKNNY